MFILCACSIRYENNVCSGCICVSMQLIWNVIYDIICQYYAKREFNIVHNHNNDNNLFIKVHKRKRSRNSGSTNTQLEYS